MSRNEIEIAIFDAVDVDKPLDSWRHQVVELAFMLDQLGALTQNDIEQLRRSREQRPQEIERFSGPKGHT